MSNSNIWSALSLLVAGLAASGCEYHDCDDDPFCDEDEDHDEARDEGGSAKDCSQACGRLVACGRIDRSARAQCEQSCSSAVAKNDFGTRLYCRCAEQTSCGDLIEECGPIPPTLVPTAPPPSAPDAGAPNAPAPPTTPPVTPPATPPAQPSTPDAGTSWCARDAAAPAPGCRSHAECATVEVCVEGACRARCEAPCDCRAGDACIEGVCLPSAAAAVCPFLTQ